mmetsp:Transcript_87698/g.274724  ORF Transcript_87698/g.274724 Transcript_87698/m.274724 type:complete len:363 (+) Transcript_87698:785-1873(+)
MSSRSSCKQRPPNIPKAITPSSGSGSRRLAWRTGRLYLLRSIPAATPLSTSLTSSPCICTPQSWRCADWSTSRAGSSSSSAGRRMCSGRSSTPSTASVRRCSPERPSWTVRKPWATRVGRRPPAQRFRCWTGTLMVRSLSGTSRGCATSAPSSCWRALRHSRALSTSTWAASTPAFASSRSASRGCRAFHPCRRRWALRRWRRSASRRASARTRRRPTSRCCFSSSRRPRAGSPAATSRAASGHCSKASMPAPSPAALRACAGSWRLSTVASTRPFSTCTRPGCRGPWSRACSRRPWREWHMRCGDQTAQTGRGSAWAALAAPGPGAPRAPVADPAPHGRPADRRPPATTARRRGRGRRGVA